MHGEAPRSYVTGVPGWETPAEQAMLVTYAQMVKPGGLIVEIGAEFGMSTSLFCYATDRHDPKTLIVSVDLFPGDMLEKHKQNIIDAGFAAAKLERVKGDSRFVGDNWFTPIDLLFIDGDHTYRGAYTDLNHWVRHVKQDGIIMFHDVAQPGNDHPHPQHYEVAAAIRDYLADVPGEFEEIDRAESMLVCRKLSPTRVRLDSSAKEPI